VSAIRLIMAQRLVRRLDDATKQPYQPDEATKAHLQSILDTLPPNVEHPSLDNIQLYKPGLSPENPYGFRGQLAIREQLTMNEEIRAVLDRTTAVVSTKDLEAAAVKGGMLTMLQDGALKALRGETTLEEIYRVVG